MTVGYPRAMAAPRPLVAYALWALCLLALLRLALFATAVASLPTDGFAAYHTAARLLRQGEPVARFYDDDWFSARVADEAPTVHDIYFVNPPAATLLLLPFAGLEYAQARIAWTFLSTLMLLVASAWIVREARLGEVWAPLALILVLSAQPVYADLHQGQVYSFLLLLFTAAWFAYRRGNESLLGACLGLALVLKTAGLVLLPMLLIQRRWRALLATGATVAVVAAGVLPWIGLDAWLRYVGYARQTLSQPFLAVTAYQDLPGFVQHLTVADPVWNPAPLVDLPGLSRWLEWASSLALVAVVLWVASRSGGATDLGFALALIASVVLSPVSLDYHYLLLLLPVVILLASLRQKQSVVGWCLMVVAVVLIATDLPYRAPALTAGAWSLLAYPKLFGALVLCGLTFWLARQGCEVHDESRADPARL